MAKNGIFCLEGEWDSDLRKRESVLPALELLERLGEIKFIHRDVATRQELEHYLTRWQQKRYEDFRILNLTAHGEDGALEWSKGNATTLDDLAEILGPHLRGRYVYLGSCRVLFDEKTSRSFLEKTGAEAVLGYRANVGWLEGMALEVVMLPALANHTGRPKTLFNNLMKRHRELASLYKLVMVTKTETLRSQDHPTSS